MPSEPSPSSPPLRRPSITQRTSSTQSLSSSAKHLSQKFHQAHRPHVVGRAQRNTSVGKNLNKTGRVTSTHNIVEHGVGHHRRQRSGPSTISTSPKASTVKRNSSHVALPKNASHTNFRKNHSNTSMVRNASHIALKKRCLGPPAKRQKEHGKKAAGFELGDKSSDEAEEDDAAWEDSKTVSPELTRSNSVASLHKARDSDNAWAPGHPPSVIQPGPQPLSPQKASPPSLPLLGNKHKSAPNMLEQRSKSSLQHPPDPQPLASPPLLHQQPRPTRAPPAMSSISAQATRNGLPRNSSSRSFLHITYADAASSTVDPGSKSVPGVGGTSSADGGVSHFLPSTTPRDQASDNEASDYDSPSNFLPNYHPQQSISPKKQRKWSQATKVAHVPSRTQQRLELQRRETMRTSPAAVSTTPSTPPLCFGFSSSASLHSRSGSRGRHHPVGGEPKAIREDYEAASKQLGVVRRFRSPVLESLTRLKESGVLPAEAGVLTPATTRSGSKRPPSRRAMTNASATTNGVPGKGISRSLEDEPPQPMASRSSSRGKVGRVMFERQGSHDDIGLSRSRGSYEDKVEDGADGGEDDAVSAEEALLRRMWESREVYDAGDGTDA